MQTTTTPEATTTTDATCIMQGWSIVIQTWVRTTPSGHRHTFNEFQNIWDFSLLTIQLGHELEAHVGLAPTSGIKHSNLLLFRFLIVRKTYPEQVTQPLKSYTTHLLLPDFSSVPWLALLVSFAWFPGLPSLPRMERRSYRSFAVGEREIRRWASVCSQNHARRKCHSTFLYVLFWVASSHHTELNLTTAALGLGRPHKEAEEDPKKANTQSVLPENFGSDQLLETRNLEISEVR